MSLVTSSQQFIAGVVLDRRQDTCISSQEWLRVLYAPPSPDMRGSLREIGEAAVAPTGSAFWCAGAGTG